jgi:hypothetical protein
MKTIYKALLLPILFWGMNSSLNGQEKETKSQFKLTKVWESPDLLTTSESVCYDNDHHIFYVSCINGKPTDVDQNGFISRVNMDGTIATLKWIEGLNAPKGMAKSGNYLYVTDITRVVKIDIEEGIIAKEYEIARAQFLNDIAIDASGNIYISDMVTSLIHIIQNDKVETWLSDPFIQKTNGLFIQDEKLFIGTTTGIVSVDIHSKEFELIVPNEGGIDGLKGIYSDKFIISDWAGKVQLVGENTEAQVILNTTESKVNAADFEFIENKNLIIIPTFFDNRVMAFEIIEE